MANKVLNQSSELLTRESFSKVSGSLPLPNLVEIQTTSYRQFIDGGINEVFEDV